MKKENNINKPVLIAGVVIFTISVCIIFPYESSKTSYLAELHFTFLTLALAMFTLMYGLMGKHFFKGLLFLIFSAIFGFCSWAIFLYNDFWGVIPALYAGVPAGIVAGLVFLIFNYQFIKDDNKTRLFVKRLILYSVILFISSLLFAKGGDWIFELTEYFKNK
ncbi:hypothetical protein [Pedobacter xixiisoli]|uniref:Uncharacterized protein n=1 Tax=Pedobacter xixiisoli TaxID=1476464 RepID=A0A286A8W6_9SPHI|nr:hypothetical protein [Pedobacter xixiisoli]SOD18354.1 hypothetical protein SAMN06297358_2957 [Pedobacter xixiisoli]